MSVIFPFLLFLYFKTLHKNNNSNNSGRISSLVVGVVSVKDHGQIVVEVQTDFILELYLGHYQF